jgi:hypothetical protein
MITFVHRIKTSGGKIHLEGGAAADENMTDGELRLATTLDTVMRAALTEVLRHVDEGTTLIETKMIQAEAEEAIRKYLRDHPPE